MQSHRTAGSPPVKSSPPFEWTGRVLGLGVCDLLRVQLSPEQVPPLVEQLAETRVVYERALARDRARWQAIPEFEREARPPSVVEAEKDLDASRFELRSLDIIRSQLRDGDRPTILGPSRIVAELVRSTARRVAGTLHELLERPPRGDAEARASLVQVAAAARAWTETHVECEAIEWCRFELDQAAAAE